MGSYGRMVYNKSKRAAYDQGLKRLIAVYAEKYGRMEGI